ncbi:MULTISPECIES: hypothetical protein [unclassified Amycolatopsis]|uniref:hypothetical protein n=1 Tax=unclassified Amycolatopsis TaxID=2618356 RepID=UPI0018F5A75C|nr:MULTISPECIES: hypothetical protein [unclassified Amycolatopsis]
MGAAAALLEAEISATDLRDAVAPLPTDPHHQRRTMAARARELGRPDAAERLVDVVLDAVRGALNKGVER